MKQISATSLTKYYTCPYCWKLTYYYKLLQPLVPAFLVGTAFHRACELYHAGVPVEGLWQQLKDSYLNQSDPESVKRFELITSLVDFYLKYPLELKTLEAEKQFTITVPDLPIPLFGYIDGVVDGGIKEYKTTSEDYKQETIDNPQSKLYSYVYYKLYGKLPLVTYYVVNKKKVGKPRYRPQILQIQYNDGIIGEVENLVKDFYHKVETKQFEPSEEGHWPSIDDYCPTAFVRFKPKQITNEYGPNN